MPQQPAIGDDVSALMPPIGADVSALMAAQVSPEPAAPEKSIGGFLSNIGSDIVGNVTGMANTVMHPIKALQAIASEKPAFEQRAMEAGQAFERGERPHADPMGAAGAIGEQAYERPVSTAMQMFPGAKPSIGLRAVKGGLENTAIRTMRGALKSPTGELNKMQGVRQAGLDRVSSDVAETALKQGINPLTRRGLETTQTRIESLNAVRDADIAAAPQIAVTGSGQRTIGALKPVTEKYRNQSMPDADVNAVGDVGRALMRNPRTSIPSPTAGRKREPLDLAPAEMNALNKGDNRALQGKFGKVGDAEIDALKAVRNERAAMMDDAVPGTRETGQQMRDLINLRNVANVARKRGEGRDLIGINDIISLSSGRPSTFLLSTAMKPAAQAGIAGGMYRTGAALPSQIDLKALYRLALMSQLTGDE